MKQSGDVQVGVACYVRGLYTQMRILCAHTVEIIEYRETICY